MEIFRYVEEHIGGTKIPEFNLEKIVPIVREEILKSADVPQFLGRTAHAGEATRYAELVIPGLLDSQRPVVDLKNWSQSRLPEMQALNLQPVQPTEGIILEQVSSVADERWLDSMSAEQQNNVTTFPKPQDQALEAANQAVQAAFSYPATDQIHYEELERAA